MMNDDVICIWNFESSEYGGSVASGRVGMGCSPGGIFETVNYCQLNFWCVAAGVLTRNDIQ